MWRLKYVIAMSGISVGAYAQKLHLPDCRVYLHHEGFYEREDELETILHKRGYRPLFYTWKDNSRELTKDRLRMEISTTRTRTPRFRPNVCTVNITVEQITEQKKHQRTAYTDAGYHPLQPEFDICSDVVARAKASQWTWHSTDVLCDEAVWRALVRLPRCVEK